MHPGGQPPVIQQASCVVAVAVKALQDVGSGVGAVNLVMLAWCASKDEAVARSGAQPSRENTCPVQV